MKVCLGFMLIILLNLTVANPVNDAQILKYENEVNENGYNYGYETSDGSKHEESGVLNEHGVLAVKGSYSYLGDDGVTYTVYYTADENGYRATGDHIPKGADGYLINNNNEEGIGPPLGIPPSAVLSLIG